MAPRLIIILTVFQQKYRSTDIESVTEHDCILRVMTPYSFVTINTAEDLTASIFRVEVSSNRNTHYILAFGKICI
jgi:hypothetical protein